MTENEQKEQIAAVIIAGGILKHSPELVAEDLMELGYRKVERGEWAGNAYFGHCSECGMVVNWSNVPRRLYNYCPHCGADMRSNKDDKKRKDQLL